MGLFLGDENRACAAKRAVPMNSHPRLGSYLLVLSKVGRDSGGRLAVGAKLVGFYRSGLLIQCV